MKTATAVEISSNSKIGRVSATYATQQTCPTTGEHACKLFGNGCYAESGFVAITTNRLNKAAETSGYTVEQHAQLEADAVNGLSGKLPLRLHVVGDCTTDKAAQTLSNAASNHTSKYGQIVWTYTHAWRDVLRKSWSDVSVLASCESTVDVKAAHSKGYAAAIVVPAFEQPTAYVRDGIKIIPCPVQTGKAESCSTCKLCMRAPSLLAGKAAIAFEAHGSQVSKAKAVLTQITL